MPAAQAGIVGLLAGLIGTSAAALIGDPLFGVGVQTGIWGGAVGVIALSGPLAAISSAVLISRQEPVSHLREGGA